MAYNWRREYSRYQRYYLNLRNIYEEKPDVRAYLGILLSLIAISFFAVFAIRPTLNTIASLVSQTDAQRETAKKLQEKVENLERAQTLWLSIQDRLPRIKEAVPDEPEPASFLRQIESLAARNGIGLSSSSLEEVVLFGKTKTTTKSTLEEKLPGEVRGLTFALTVSSSYQGLSRFLTDFTRLRRPVVLNTVIFSSPPTGGNITLSITGVVPYQTEK